MAMAAMTAFGFLAVFAGAGCTMVDPQLKAAAGAVAPQPPGTRAVPLRFVRLEGRMRHGAEIGRYTWGVLCKPPYRTISWETGRAHINLREYADVFYDAMTHLGYDVAGDPGKMFDQEEDEARAELLVSGQVDEIALDLCRRYSWWFGGYTGYTGAAIIRVVWTVYDHLRRRVVYQTATTGFGQEDDTNADAQSLILQRAFTDAAAALGKDEGFRRVAFQPQGRAVAPGPVPPGPTPLTVPRPSEPRPDPDYPLGPGAEARPPAAAGSAAFDPAAAGSVAFEDDPGLLPGGPRLDAESDHPAPGALAEMTIPRQRPRAGPITANAGELVRATVVIANAAGSGSGFFVARDPEGGGWILTNAHVVGDAERVRVSTFDRRARIGTVVRRHRARDVALVRVEGGIPAVVSIRETPLTVGEEVYAMGEPLGQANRNTLTHGVVSRFTKSPGARLPLIQSDVTTQHGDSGGPLADRSGNVVALDVAGLKSAVDRSVGINYFIPIADAFDRLRLVLSGKA